MVWRKAAIRSRLLVLVSMCFVFGLPGKPMASHEEEKTQLPMRLDEMYVQSSGAFTVSRI